MKTPRPARALIGAGTAAALVGAALVASNLPATGAPTPGSSASCPTAYVPGPGNKLPAGLEVTGLTTAGTYTRPAVGGGKDVISSPTAPEEFQGVYLDTIEDPFGDLFIFDFSGSRITNPDGSVDAGIWAGISGSPVYAADGSLVGSVSYAFTGLNGSTYGGVTPAADLYGLLAETDEAPAAITLDRSQRQSLQRAGVPAAVTRHDLKRLSGPVIVSGARAISPKLHSALAKKAGLATTPLLAGGTATQDQQIPVVAGGNVAVAASYGATALYSVGTATAVCDDIVIGYGHPDSWAPSDSTIHGASTAVIIADGPNSYKLANLAGPVGSLVSDRMGGITGRVGALPDAVSVTVNTTGPKPRTTESSVSNLDALSYVVATQIPNDAALALDENGPGTADLSWAITFTRADGSTQVFERSQTYASSYSVPEEVSYDVASDVATLLENGFEDITITDVTVTQDVSRSYAAYKLGRVETKAGGSAWSVTRDGSKVKLKPGKKVKVRVQLVKADRKAQVSPVTRTFTFKTPKKAVGTGELNVHGNGASFWDFDDFFFTEMFEEGSGLNEDPADLDGLLAAMQSPRQDTLDVTLNLTHAKKGDQSTTQSWSPGAVVSGDHYTTLKFKTKKAKKN